MSQNTASRISVRLNDYAQVIGAAEIQEIRALASGLQGKRVKMVNSTAVGGGVAEILARLVPLLHDAGLHTKWDVITGGEEFFAITKAFHNALHGAPYDGKPHWFELFRQTNEMNRQRLEFDEEFVVIHDPQPVGLVNGRQGLPNHWVWRCHIDLTHANRVVWDFLRPFVEKYDASLFSSPAFTQGLPIPQFLFFPTIDPLADKNKDLDPGFVRGVFERFCLDPRRPTLTQISRFDRLKDPVGVIMAYKLVKKHFDCQLVLAGGSASDDPEGAAVLQEVRNAAGRDKDIHILDLPPTANEEINALQRGSTIVIQKSLREGFGLTVSEALWKRKPVVASAVGGIPSQVIHKLTGMLVHSVEGCAYQIRYLLSNPEFAQTIANNGHEHVKENFLITSNLKRYLLLFLILQRQQARGSLNL